MTGSFIYCPRNSDVSSWGFWNYQKDKTGHVNYLQISTSSPAIGQSVLPEQRIIFAKGFEKLFHDKGMDAKVTTHGDKQTMLQSQVQL
jgi:hypothetical protein